MRVRTAASLCIYSTPDDLRVVDIVRQRRWAPNLLEQPALLTFLLGHVDWQDYEACARFLCEIVPCDLQRARSSLDELLEAGLLDTEAADPEDDPTHIASRASWFSLGWSLPFYYHWHSNMLPKFDYSASAGVRDRERMREYYAHEKPPDSYKTVEAERIALTPYRLASEQLRPVDAERDRQRLTFAEFSWFVYLAYGQTGWRTFPVSGRHVTKTSPSGGSRHPTEVYAIVLDVEGVPPGLYHYNVQAHGLEVLEYGDLTDFVFGSLLLPAIRPEFTCRSIFVYATIFERSMFRYRESRSYRVVHHDIGHMMCTSRLLARELSRAVFHSYSLREHAVESKLGIDGLRESAMAFTAVE